MSDCDKSIVLASSVLSLLSLCLFVSPRCSVPRHVSSCAQASSKVGNDKTLHISHRHCLICFLRGRFGFEAVAVIADEDVSNDDGGAGDDDDDDDMKRLLTVHTSAIGSPALTCLLVSSTCRLLILICHTLLASIIKDPLPLVQLNGRRCAL